MQELSRRIAAYDKVNEAFGIIGNLSTNMSASEIVEGVRCMCEKYPEKYPLKKIFHRNTFNS